MVPRLLLGTGDILILLLSELDVLFLLNSIGIPLTDSLTYAVVS